MKTLEAAAAARVRENRPQANAAPLATVRVVPAPAVRPQVAPPAPMLATAKPATPVAPAPAVAVPLKPTPDKFQLFTPR